MNAPTEQDADVDASGEDLAAPKPRPPFHGAAPHPLARMAERLGRSPGRRPLPDVFEQYLRDQLTRDRVTSPARSALLPSRDLTRRRKPARRPDV